MSAIYLALGGGGGGGGVRAVARLHLGFSPLTVCM